MSSLRTGMFGGKIVGRDKKGAFEALGAEEKKAEAVSIATATQVQPVNDENDTETVIEQKPAPKSMSFVKLLYVLRPFFWPSKGSDGAFKNRIRAVSTWFAVGLSKASSVYAPFFLAGIYTSELVFLHHTNLMFLCLISFPFLFPSPKLRRTILWREIAMVRHETSFSFVPSCSLVLSSRKCKLCCMLV